MLDYTHRCHIITNTDKASQEVSIGVKFPGGFTIIGVSKNLNIWELTRMATHSVMIGTHFIIDLKKDLRLIFTIGGGKDVAIYISY